MVPVRGARPAEVGLRGGRGRARAPSATIATATRMRISLMGVPASELLLVRVRKCRERRSTTPRRSMSPALSCVRARRDAVSLRGDGRRAVYPPGCRRSPPGSGSTPTRSPTSSHGRSARSTKAAFPSCQIAFARARQVGRVDHARRRRAESRYVIFSSTKPVVASAIWILMGEGAIDVSQRGRGPRAGVRRRTARTRSRSSRCCCTRRASRARRSRHSTGTTGTAGSPGSRSGGATGSRDTRFEYHPTSAHWVLAELIERVHRRRLPGLRPHACDRAARPARASSSACRSSSRATSTRSSPPARPPSPDELEAVLGVRELPADGGDDRGAPRLQPARRCARSAFRAAVASRPRPISRSSTRRC